MVGVDDMQISIQGSALIRFSISSIHEFIIADHVTVQVIVTWTRFLKVSKCILDLSKQEMTIHNKVAVLQLVPSNAAVKCVRVIVMDTIVVPASSDHCPHRSNEA